MGTELLQPIFVETLLIQLGSLLDTVDAYVLEWGGLDVVLGVAWLQTLYKVIMD